MSMVYCFLCGYYYEPQQSSAPTEYKLTYCSEGCYLRDKEEMEKYSLPESTNQVNKPEEPATTEVQIGQFRIKVKKEE